MQDLQQSLLDEPLEHGGGCQARARLPPGLGIATRFTGLVADREKLLAQPRPVHAQVLGRPVWPFQAQGETCPGKDIGLRCTSAGFTSPCLGHEGFCGPWSARPARRRPTSGFCSSARSFARCDQLARGLPPPSRCPCWAHQEKDLAQGQKRRAWHKANGPLTSTSSLRPKLVLYPLVRKADCVDRRRT